MSGRVTHGQATVRGRPVFFLSAGDPSGDLYGCRLVEALRRRHPDAFFLGLGGERMAHAGVHLLAPPERLATVGFTEVVRDLSFFCRLLAESDAILGALRPDLVVMIDYPGFNLRLARRARRRGIRTLYYISPQVWAWRPGRARSIIRDSDEIAVIFPFEVDFYRERGRAVHFVGHPMPEELARREPVESFRARYGLRGDRPILGLSPGSRRVEIERHLPVFLDVARRLRERVPGLQVVIHRAPGIDGRALRARCVDGDGPVVLVNDSRHTSIEACRLLLTKSGTSTIEAALLGTPLVVGYRMSPISFGIARSLVRLPHVAMVNILAGRTVVPEFLQERCTAGAILPVALDLLGRSPRRDAMLEGLREVREMLGEGGATERVADLAAALAGGDGGGR